MNKKFGKLEDGNLIYAPSVLIVEEGFEIVTSYRIVEAEEEKYIERAQEYKALPPLPPQQPTLEERVASVEGETEMLTACVLEMSELVYV